jgi:hypothetical protein
MLEGMIPNCMTLLNDLLKDIGVFSDVVPDAKKSGFSFIFPQGFQDPGSDFRNWTIIKSEEQFFFFS